MDDRPDPVRRRAVVRLCESSRFQRQLLARAYQQVYPQVVRPLGREGGVTARPCGAAVQNSTAARVAAGA